MVRVRADGDHHADSALRIIDRRHQVREEALPLRLIGDDREQLLELVDHQHEPCGIVWKQAQRRPKETELRVRELRVESVRRIDRRAQQRRLELRDRMRARHHRRDEPCLGAGQRPLAQRGHHARSGDARLARSTRPNESDQPGAGTKPCDHLGHEPVSSEEVGGVRLLERVKPLERARDRVGLGRFERGKALVVEQDLLLEAAYLRRGLEAELVTDPQPITLARAEGLGLPPRAIEPPHQLGHRALAQWVLIDEDRELGDQLRPLSAPQIGLDAGLDRFEAELFEPGDLGPRELLVGEVLERRASPE